MKGWLALFSILVLSACNGSKNQTNIELIQDMMDQINVKAQDWDPDTKGNFANHYPPEHTNPIGYKPVPFQNDPLAANEKLKNPFDGNMSPEIVARGKAKYEIFCYPCHGPDLIGNGLVAAKMLVKPPSLLSDKIRGYHDGRIFHIISYGQGVMGSYASQIHDKEDRWAIIKYIRSMQNKN